MSVIGSEILAGASGNQGYFLQRSLRFRSSASAYLNRTPASASNDNTWTWSSWIKRGELGYKTIYSTASSIGSNTTLGQFYFDNSDKLYFFLYTGGTTYSDLFTTAAFRDPSAWYHVVLTYDDTQSTSTNRVKIYVNGVQQTLTGSYPTQNFNGFFNTSQPHVIGRYSGSGDGVFFDGYITEINLIDGQALTPSSFGEYSTSTGVWQPKKYAGTYGTNGFYLPFSNNASTTTLGNDFSGNGNNWTTNNISLTAGSTYDSMTDVPTLTSATASNFATLNPLQTGSYVTASQGNLRLAGNTSTNSAISSATIGNLTSGKWYWEYTQGTPNSETCGISTKAITGSLLDAEVFASNNGVGARANGDVVGIDNTTSSITSWTTNDIIGLALDCDSGAIYWSKNGTWLNSGVPTSGGSKTGAVGAWTPSDAKVITPIFGAYNAGSITANFGQRPFAYTPPTGFVALNTYNLPTPTIGATASTQANKYFDATTYTGTGATRSVVNSGAMQPSFLWIKRRSVSGNHVLFDSVRGGNKSLSSNLTDAESSEAFTITYDSNGFTLPTADSAVNANGTTYVGWQWAGNGTGVSNTAGSITSTVSANTSAGFSVVTYTGTGSNATVGHGLGVAPKMIIIKNRTGVYNWRVWHTALSSTELLYLNTTEAKVTGQTTAWNSTLPTSTVFSLGSSGGVNESSSTFVAYCFSEVAGYSKFGSYTGNGSTDGTFVYLGFRPKYILIKQTANNNWIIRDSSRNTYNAVNSDLFPDLSNAESSASNRDTDFLSNGFKLRGTGTGSNDSGGTYIYMAFAEHPFKYSLAR
jgi:hypothetical protein